MEENKGEMLKRAEEIFSRFRQTASKQTMEMYHRGTLSKADGEFVAKTQDSGDKPTIRVEGTGGEPVLIYPRTNTPWEEIVGTRQSRKR